MTSRSATTRSLIIDLGDPAFDSRIFGDDLTRAERVANWKAQEAARPARRKKAALKKAQQERPQLRQAADGAVEVVFDEGVGIDGFVYRPHVRIQHRRHIDALPVQQQAVIAASSLLWWRRRLAGEYKAVHRAVAIEDRPSLAAWVAQHTRVMRGSGSCTRTWSCCDYCAHGRTMEAMARFLAHAQAGYFVTFRPVAPEGWTPARLASAVGLVLVDYDAVIEAPRFIGAALLAPSRRSASADLNGKLHLHAIIDNPGVFDHDIAAIAALHGLRARADRSKREDRSAAVIEADVALQAEAFAYALEQVPAVDAQHRSGEVRTPVWLAQLKPKPIERVRRSRREPMLRDALKAARQANRDSFVKGLGVQR